MIVARLGRRWAEVQAALMLMTRLPVGRVADPFPPTRDTVWAYPLAGAVVGGVGGLVMAAGLAIGWPPGIAVVLAMAATAILTGALHEDGLADCADSMGGWGRDRRLAILKDSRIGTFGALALILSVALRAQGYMGQGDAAPALMVALGIASRAPIGAILALLPPARTEGMGAEAARPDPIRVMAALLIGVVAALWAGGLPVLIAMGCAATLVALAARRAFGGQTGDALGASQQLAEIAALLVLAAG